jgi:hypothetical protein
MKNHTLELTFRKPSECELPGPGTTQIQILTQSQNTDCESCITPMCCCFEEINAEIDRLQKELESIRERAKVMYEAFPK